MFLNVSKELRIQINPTEEGVKIIKIHPLWETENFRENIMFCKLRKKYEGM